MADPNFNELDGPENDRPEWLIGAQDDIQSTEAAPAPTFELRRPQGLVPVPPVSSREKPAIPEKKPWVAASSSVPRLSVKAPAQAPAAEKILDDAIPEDEASTGFLGNDPRELAATSQGPAAASGLRPLEEPWWVVWSEALATNRKVQALVAVAVLAIIAACVFWPRGEPGVSLRQIRQHPEIYENRAVHVRGRIGDVFQMGGGYVFNLHQGRDTVVVFTRVRVPVTRAHTDVVGTVSTGYLDGVARVAVLETEGH